MSEAFPRDPFLLHLRKTLPFIAPFRRSLGGIVALSLAVSCLTAAEPLVLKQIFDGLTEGRHLLALVWPIALFLVLLAARELLVARLDAGVWKTRLGINRAIVHATVERLHALPLAFHRQESVGGIMTKMDRGINGFVAAFSEVAFTILPAAVYLLVSVSIMVRLDAKLALLVVLFAPLAPLIGARAAREQAERERGIIARFAKIFSRLHEVLSGIVVVKCFATEETEKHRFFAGFDDASELVYRGVRTDARYTAAKNLTTAAARVAALGFGVSFVANGRITVGTLIAFLGYLGGLFGPVQGLTNLYQTLRRGAVAVETIFSILDAGDPLGDAPDAVDVKLSGRVEFRQVGFAYGGDRRVLGDINVEVLAGQTVALVGPSGAGKTTFTNLLQRLYDPEAGAILLDGVDLRKLQQRSVRRQMGVVLQESVLFDDTIRANIAFGQPNAAFEDVERAARAANAHDFIVALPSGYETRVGAGGGRLSTGQKQRIAIARALLKNPAILVLDEATSALDPESEKLVSEALARLSLGRTTFVIAHRLSTVVRADRILVLREGTIVESGTHRELLDSKGFYASLVKSQVHGILWDAA